VKALNPITGRKGGLKQQGAHDIVGGTNHALGLATLRGSVGTRHAKLDAVREEESAGGVIKLASIITLDVPDGAAKLCGHKGEEVGEGGEDVRLLAQQKSSRVVGAVIEDDQVILVTRDTRNRGGPKVTMYEVKGLNDSSRGARKEQPNVPTKLVGMVQGIISALPRGQVIAELLDSLERTLELGWPRQRWQVAEKAAVTKAYGTTRKVGVVEVGRGRV
jgi:hypothetical protein